MQVVFEKHRPAEYRYELENEFERLKIAKNSFCHIITPQEFKLDGLSLSTKKIGEGSSNLFKKQYSPEHFIEQYLNIINMLWKEELKTELDLTPEWVKSPKLKKKNNLHPDFKNKTESELLEILSRKTIYTNKKRYVVHGDLCPVNVIFDEKGRAIGLIDLGDMHMGNKMLDIAVLSWTIRGWFGREYENDFLTKLGVNSDDKELEYYRLIYDLSLPDYKSWGWIKE